MKQSDLYYFIGTTRELWPRSKTKSLEMTSKLGIQVGVTSNSEAGKLALNMACKRTW